MAVPSKPNAYQGRATVFSSTDPGKAMINGVTIAVKLDGTDRPSDDDIRALMQQAKDQGIDVKFVGWQVQATAEGVAEAKSLGLEGIIFEEEGRDQLPSTSLLAKQAQAQGLDVAVVTNLDGVGAGQWGNYFDPHVTAIVETYTNKNPDGTPANQRQWTPAIMRAAALNAGITNPVLAIGTYDATSEGGGRLGLSDYYYEQLKTLGISAFAAFSIEGMSDADIEALKRDPRVKALLAGSTGGAGSSAGSPLTKKPKPQALGTKKPGLTGAPKKEEPVLGLQGPHDPAGTKGAPPAYRGGAPIIDDPNNPNDTFSFTDKKHRRVTITTTASGAKIERVAGETPYQIKAPDPKPPFDPSRPAWHQNANWGSADSSIAAKAGLDPNQVLEQRPAAVPGHVILRMADGSYQNVDTATGQYSSAGNWNKDQWEVTQGGSLPAPTGPPSTPDIPPPATPNPLPPGGVTDPTPPSSTPSVPPEANPLSGLALPPTEHGHVVY